MRPGNPNPPTGPGSSPASSPGPGPNATAGRLVAVAEDLMRMHGYHGFSYADVAARVGIRKASIHHHFPAKPDLAAAAIHAYRQRFREAAAAIADRHPSPPRRMRAFGELFLAACRRRGAGCMCGSLAADWTALPEPVQAEVAGHWSDARRWLRIELWRDAADPPSAGVRARLANALLALLQGSLLGSRIDGDERALRDAVLTAERLVRTPT